MPSSSSIRNLSFCLFIISLFLLFLSPKVRSVYDFSVLRLPSDAGDAELDVGVSSVCPDLVVKPGSCPVRCFRPDPVCGEDGVTYWCGCADAHCAGKRVAKIGFCEVGSGGSGLLSGQALLLVHIVWLIVLGLSVLCGLL
ncbi:hypothetical protein Nepgr_031382 [Nepenthes gracilis]|uniref:Uncharacterized protein n=1 Tax=Nepenthes gracilis TaxID=150966 RepID=A0AAD3TI62_NEPGR|nr:hypothetical protein Nepgr_031382 [Nepenthes gracilis]